jgi:hypothetical protein
VGRQIGVALAYEDEQDLVDQLQNDGYVVVPERMPTPRLWEHVWDKLPTDEKADPWDYACTIVPAILARTHQAQFVGLASPLDTRPRGSIPTRLAYSAHTIYLPSIEWHRNRRVGPRTLRIPGGGGRFYIDTQREYGSDEQWKETLVSEYEKIVKLIKMWTISRGKWSHWSRRLDPPPSEEEYLRLMEASKVTSEQREVCDRFEVYPWPVGKNLRVGVARDVKPGSLSINGLRHPPKGDMTGWYVWVGEQESGELNLFSQLHLEHLVEWCPTVWRYLALPPGWRFSIAPGNEDVWHDPSLLHPEGDGL